MLNSKFEHILYNKNPKKEEVKINKKEKLEKEKKEPKTLVKLIRLKQGNHFLIPGSDIKYRLLVKYKHNKITAREIGTSNVIELDGETKIIPVDEKIDEK